jgi:hypothetical protein
VKETEHQLAFLLLESPLVCVYLWDLYRFFNYEGWSRGLSKPWNCTRLGVVLLIVVDMSTRLLFGLDGPIWSQPLRPFIILFRRHTLRTMFTVPATLLL